ncbi:hypothetical protein V6N12_028955 [Hibiscus sabdariffa]|uniref:Uncharacterized protein n=1 Tax=Hibiscus sabdariffa TaxID=183260 RepID=A0ABR2F7C5_9ROSI
MSKDSRSVDSSMSGSFGGRPSKGYGSGKTPTATVGSGNLVLVAVMSISTTSGNRNKGVDSYVVVDGTEALEKSTPTVVDKGKVSYADVAVKGICDYGISLNGGGLDNDSMDTCGAASNAPTVEQPVGNVKDNIFMLPPWLAVV